MKRRDFLRLSALGLSIYTLPGCRSSHNNNDYQPPFEIPGYDGQSHRFIVIGDNHNDCNILKGMLEEAENQGIKDILLLGDQVDNYSSHEGKPAGYLADSYMNIIKENEFDKKFNFYPVRGNHDTYSDDEDNNYYKIKSFYNEHVGKLVNENVITRPSYTQFDGNPLDCCSTYSFILGSTLFIALDFFFTHKWKEEGDDYLTLLHDKETGIYQGEEWLLNKEFIEETIKNNKGKFDNIITFGHYPFAGHNHGGDLRGDLKDIENKRPGFTKSLLSVFSDNNIVYLCGHDHHVSKSLIYPSGSMSYVDNLTDASPENFEQPHFIQMICGSSSYKHYANEYTVLDGYEVPLYLQHTRGVRDNDQLNGKAPETTNHMMVVELRGSLMNMTMLGNSHNWQTSDGNFSDDDGFRNSLIDPNAEQFYLDPNNWHISSVTNLFREHQSLIVPPNGNYEAYVSSAKFSGNRATTMSISSGKNETFNSLCPTERAKEKYECLDLGFAEQISFVWLKSRQEKVLSDVLFIDGMQEQSGVNMDEFGNVVNDMPWYIEPKPKTDSFTLTFKTKLPSSISDGVTMACYDEASEQWEPLNTSYQDGCFISENVSQNGFFAIVER
ncbi:hypothetical protein SKA34_07633 [Photobacterium sp. SKA34]|uniref:metallophosphoesterase family protein n=1 Tax=Photobacterium sp. SKA34 TaxID=121723 RepID=UPI00006B4CE0|nr:metallophosphoesterase [Photobacterium sp. SKA34]EAR53473.1 hypothetical protein SKA34_07633 [Photobacterium sp. SKA34]